MMMMMESRGFFLYNNNHNYRQLYLLVVR